MFNNKYLMAIVPHRGVNAGKSRLSSVLTDVGRGKLNRWLLTRTLGVVTAWLGDAQRCVVVSPCEVTLALARKAGTVALPEQADTTGLNAALAQAAAHAATLGAERVLILPCDLPRLDGEALSFMQSTAAIGTEWVIAPDRHHKGTNALLVDADVPEFAFGKDSMERHFALGAACGVRTFPCAHPALAFDLDTAEDFAEWSISDDAPQDFVAALPRTACIASPGAGFVSSRTK